MTKQHLLSGLKAGAAPIVIGLALVSVPAFAQDTQSTDTPNQNGSSVSGPLEQGNNAPQPDVSANGAAPTGGDIVVTGSRIPQPNLTSNSPVTIVSSQDVKLQGTTRVEDLLNSLPSVFADESSGVTNGTSGIASVNLRGLGAVRTLVLVNGRRLLPGDPQEPVADINMIPSSLIKRVDVLTGGASSTYGSDAVAGVVNFVMDTDFTGFRIDGQYSFFPHDNHAGNQIRSALNNSGFGYPDGVSANGGTIDTTVSFGANFGDSGQGHIVAYGGYRKINAVTESSRDYSSCALAALDDGGFRCAGSGTSATGQVITNTGVDVGIHDNEFSGAPALYNYGPRNYYQRNDERYTAGFFADYKISDALHPYAEFMFQDDRTTAQIAESGDFGNTFTLNCDNPLLSAQQLATVCSPGNFVGQTPNFDDDGNFTGTFTGAATNFTDANGNVYQRANATILRRNVEGGPRQDDLQHTDYRGVIGMRGQISPAWSYDAYYQYSRVNYAETYLNDFSATRLTRALDVVADPASGNAVCRSVLDGTDPNCVPYNIFTPGGVTSAATNYVSTPGFQRGMTEEQVASASITGQLGQYGIKSPFASDGVGLNIGVEHRKESLALQTDTEFQTGDLTGQGAATLPISGSFSVDEAYGEVRVPVIEDSFIHELTFNGGYRYSHYTNAQNSFNTSTYKIEGHLSPVRDITFRGGYNRAVRAPNVQELFAPNRVALDGSIDPCAGPKSQIDYTAEQCALTGLPANRLGTIPANSAAQYNGLIGGNADLKPEKGTTYTFGAVLQPRFIPGFSATVDYYHIKIKDVIQGIGADTIITTCLNTGDPQLCSLIHRDPTSYSLYLGPNGYIDDRTQNLGSLKTSGIDVGAAYNRRLGGLGSAGLSFQGTYLKSLTTDNGVSAPYNCKGYFGTTCGSPNPEWRHKLRLTFTLPDGIGLSGQWRYFSSTKEDTLSNTISQGSPSSEPANAKIPSVSYFDLAMTANVTDMFGLRIGAENVLDKDPPVVGTNAGGNNALYNGNTYTTYDVLGRYVYVGITLNL